MPRSESARLAESGKTASAAEVVRNELDLRDIGLPDPDDSEERWKAGFILARSVQGALLQAGVIPFEVHPDIFVDVVAEAAEWYAYDHDELMLGFEEAWRIIQTPEGQSKLSYAFHIAQRSGWRAPLTTTFSTRGQTEDAELLATTLVILQRLYGPPVFLPGRSVADLMGKSREYVRTLIRRLIDDGTFEITRSATRREATEMVYVEPDSRKPPGVVTGSSGSSRSPGFSGTPGVNVSDLSPKE